MGWPAARPDQLPADWTAVLQDHPDTAIGRVVEQHRSGYVVATGPDETAAVDSLPDWQKPRCPPEQRACVGDWVLLKVLDLHRPQIVAMLPRRNVIKRAAAGEHFKQQLIAANIDVVFVVVGLDLDFNARRLERYLMLVGAADRIVVLFTKADKQQVAADVFATVQQQLESQGISWHALNAKDSTAVSVMSQYLHEGITAVLVGSSGVGKSTLTNALIGEQRMRTNEVRSHDSRGKHTTTYRHLIPLGNGACLIDTPGMRELKPTGEEEEAAVTFKDVDALAAQCKFRDCKHLKEPGCAVNDAIAAGTLDVARLQSWRKLHDEVATAAQAKIESQKIRGRRPQS